MKKILVTGAKGQLGKKITDLLSGKYELILTDSSDMDITDKAKVVEAFKKSKPDYVIHGAAYTKVDAAEENEELCRKINSYGTKNIAEASAACGATLFYISTDFVFDGKSVRRTQDLELSNENSESKAQTPSPEPYLESDTPNPLSVYGQTKLEGEEFIKKATSMYYIIRVAWLFGELPDSSTSTNFVETMLRLAKERDSLSVVNDQIGSPTYTKDLVEVIDMIIRLRTQGPGLSFNNLEIKTQDLETSDNNPKPKTQALSSALPYGIYHFSGNSACSWYDFAKEIFQLSNIDIDLKPITSDQYPQKAKRPAYSYLSKDKIEKALDIKVRDWHDMLKEYLSKK